MTSIAARSPVPARAQKLLAALSRSGLAARTETARLTICAGATIALLIAASADNGGYNTAAWLGGAIALMVLCGWSRLVFGWTLCLGRWGRLAVISLALYAAWSYASILWAADKGAALIGADRVLLYLIVFWLFAGLEFTRRRLELSLLAYLLAIGALAVVVLVELATGPAPQLLITGQLAAGLGYHNGTAALGTIGAVGSILASCSRSHRPAVRAALAGGAAACISLSLLAQSRGWLYTLPVIIVIVLAIIPRRGRTAAWALIPAGAALATLPWVAHSWAVADGTTGAGHQTVAAADMATARAALVAALLSGCVAWLVARGQQRFVLSRRGRGVAKWISRVSAALVVGVTAVASIVLVSTGKLAQGWHQFTTDAPVRSGVSHFAQLGSGRYDIWRVAFHSFLAHPLGGLGQDNFAQAYLAARHTGEEPLWTHSLELRLLAHTGLVGLVLFVAFLAFALAACVRAGRGSDRRLRLALVAALVPLIVWLVHGSIDWFWELPALSGAAFAFLGAAVALEPGRVSPRLRELQPAYARGSAVPEKAGRSRRRVITRAGATAIGVTLAALALAALVPAYLGERALTQGQHLVATDPAAALNDLSLASRLEPLSTAPIALQAGIELRDKDATRGLALVRQGVARDPGDWMLWLEYGLAAGAKGQPGLERTALARAHALDPREPVIALAQRRAGTNDPLTIAQAAGALASRAHSLVAP